MNDRLRFFKWRAIARRMAESAPPGSAEQIAATQFRDGLDSAMIRNHDDRCIEPPNIGRGLLFHAWLLIKSKPVNLRPLSLLDMTDPANVPEAEWRISALINLFNQMASGAAVMTPAIQSAFHRAARHDPDAQVRAWALFLIDPENHPRPTDAEKGEG